MLPQKLSKVASALGSSRLLACDSFRRGTVIGSRNFSRTSVTALREIKRSEEGEKIVVEGVYVEESSRPVLPSHNKACEGACPICPLRLGVDVKYTDVLLLSQFVRSDGGLLPRYATGVCLQGQRRLATLVRYAQRAGLMPELRPDLPEGRNPKRLKSMYKWRKFNIYYGEYGEVH